MTHTRRGNGLVGEILADDLVQTVDRKQNPLALRVAHPASATTLTRTEPRAAPISERWTHQVESDAPISSCPTSCPTASTATSAVNGRLCLRGAS